MFLLALLDNATGAVQQGLEQGIKAFQGHLGLLGLGILLLIAAIAVLWLFKQILANAILGIIALMVVVYLFGVPIPMNLLTILLSVIGGLGGVAALLLATFFGLL